MNIARHMEVAFVVAVAAAGAASYLADTLPRAHARPAAIEDSSIATETRMAVVVVKAKRPGPAEKGPAVLAARRAGASRS